MKIACIALLIMLSMPTGMHAENYRDTIIRTVHVAFRNSPSIFPASWLTKSVGAHGNVIDRSELKRTAMILERSLSKYPEKVLRELRAIYVLKNLSICQLPFGGTNSADAVYLTNNGITHSYTDWYIEQTFHHEFSSILFRNHPQLLDTALWIAANQPGFGYNDKEAGLGAIRSRTSSQEIDTALCRKGFLTQYARSDIENDINTIAENLFAPSPGFWNTVNVYPSIKIKVLLLVKFYNSIDPSFTETYFKQMNDAGER
jgi:hypothetical protein